MAVEVKTFTGKLNTDNDPLKLPPNDHSQALNITRNNSEVVHNIAGNILVTNPYLSDVGINKRIGHKEDIPRNRVYEFIWNSHNFHLISYYNAGTDQHVKIFQNITDSGGFDILHFDPSYRINHVDIIYRDDDGDLVTWCTGNATPKCLNEKRIRNSEYPILKETFIEMAKKPFLMPPTCVYGTDTTRNANSLRGKLFQFAAAPEYDDFQKATLCTYSKVPLPIGYYGSDNDIADTSNNFITITIETGDINVFKLNVFMRYSIGDVWSDIIQIASLNKSQLSIPDNSTYQLLFFNDAIYQPIDINYAILLFDWVPPLAGTQALANGTVPVYCDITEGFENYPINQLAVTITAVNKTNIPVDSSTPSITYTQSGSIFDFTVSGVVPTGTIYRVYIFFNGNPGIGQTYGVRLVGEYTSLLGDTINDVAAALYSDFNSYPSVPIIGGSQAANTWQSVFGTSGNYVQMIQIIPGTPAAGTISTEKVWMYDCNYILGLAYKDIQGRIMPGVTTFSNPVSSDNDFLVTTPAISFDVSDQIQTPVISATVNHIPPAGAVSYAWVRRRMNYSNWLMYITCDYQADTDFLYFCLANVDAYKRDNNKFIWASAPVTDTSRIRVLAGISSNLYDGDVWNQDYEIVGTVTRTLTGGASPANDVPFIKVKIPTGSISPAYNFNMLVMVYTPMINPVTLEDSVYFEWAEEYGIYTITIFNYTSLTGTFVVGEIVHGGTSGASAVILADNGTNQMKVEVLTGIFVAETITGGTSGATSHISTPAAGINYHRGKGQDQNASRPATFEWAEGDVYFHQRSMYSTLMSSPVGSPFYLMDESFSDFFLSRVNDNGRALAIEANARKQRNPVLQRFGQSFEAGTLINDINRFYFLNFDEYDRGNGIIRKIFIEGRRMFVFHQFEVGVVPVLTQIIKDTSGNPLQANSDQLLNKITYPYAGKHGIGDTPESFSYSNGAKYFTDSNLGVPVRLSGDGAIELSVLYQNNNLFINKLAAYGKGLDNGIVPNGTVYTGNPTVYGTFDNEGNKYIIAFEEINRYSDPNTLIFHQGAFTISFYEVRTPMEGFESEFSYHPEGMACLNNLLICWQNGKLWRHNSTVFNNFFGIQYPSSITPVYNSKAIIKKKQLTLGYLSLNNKKWACPEITTNTVNPQTGLSQESSLIEDDIHLEETVLTAGLLRDKNSMADARKALLEGDFLGGNYIAVKFEISAANAASLVSLVDAYLTDEISQRNF